VYFDALRIGFWMRNGVAGAYMGEEIEEFHDCRCCRIVRNHARHVEDAGTSSFHEHECIECGDDSVNDLVINHVAIRLFDSKTSVMKSVQWFAAFPLALFTSISVRTSFDLFDLSLIYFPPRLEFNDTG